MKKTLLVGAMMLTVAGAWGQKARIRDARTYLSDNNYKKALVAINEAVGSEDTKDNAEAWYLRGMAYLQQAQDTTATNPNALEESYTSLMKAYTLKPDFGAELNNGFYPAAVLTFNNGLAAYRAQDWPAAHKNFLRVYEIFNIGGGKRYATERYYPAFTEIAANARSYAAYAAYYGKMDTEALTLLNGLKSGSGSKDTFVYQALADVYKRQNDDAHFISTISDANKQFPGAKAFRDMEINYYMDKNQTAVLLNKLEDAVKAEPENSDLQFNLANIYMQVAFPKSSDGKAPARPANFTEMIGKAEAAYQKTVMLNPARPEYSFNLGVLYYSLATDLQKQMNAIAGMSAAEQKQYNALESERDAQFSKALPHFEKAYAILDPNAASLSYDDKVTYLETMKGMRQIYDSRKNTAKVAELKTKIDAVN